MSNEFEEEANKVVNFPRCEVCGGYGYHNPKGSNSAARCPSCHGDKISRDPRHKI